MASAPRKHRTLLATMTHEPFQPVRLYYAIPGRAPVTARRRKLECVVEAPAERCWQWLFHGEAASLRFSAGYDDVPEERRPIILGWIRFPKNGGMTLQTNSILRAIEAARFFGPRLGPQVVAMRCRVVNRCFAAEEGQPDDLMKTLDQNVSVIDPRVAELAFEREIKGRPRPRALERQHAPDAHRDHRARCRAGHGSWRPTGRQVDASVGHESTEEYVMSDIPSEYRGWWRITETSQWVDDGLDILGPALISLTGYGDRLRMHCLLAYVNCKPTKRGVSFTWEGAWEYDQLTGSGHVTLGKDGRLRGTFRIKNGDSSKFIAVRADEPDEPIPSPPSYRDKWSRRW